MEEEENSEDLGEQEIKSEDLREQDNKSVEEEEYVANYLIGISEYMLNSLSKLKLIMKILIGF